MTSASRPMVSGERCTASPPARSTASAYGCHESPPGAQAGRRRPLVIPILGFFILPGILYHRVPEKVPRGVAFVLRLEGVAGPVDRGAGAADRGGAAASPRLPGAERRRTR